MHSQLGSSYSPFQPHPPSQHRWPADAHDELEEIPVYHISDDAYPKSVQASEAGQSSLYTSTVQEMEDQFYSTFPDAHPSRASRNLKWDWESKAANGIRHDYSFSTPHTSTSQGSFRHPGDGSSGMQIEHHASFPMRSYPSSYHRLPSTLSMVASSAPATTSRFDLEESSPYNARSYVSGYAASSSPSFHAPAPGPVMHPEHSLYDLQRQAPLPQSQQGMAGTVRLQEPPMASLDPPSRMPLQPLHSVHELYAASPTRTELSSGSVRSSYSPQQQQTQAFPNAPTPPTHYSPASSPYAPDDSTFNQHHNSGTASYAHIAPRDNSVPPSWSPNVTTGDVAGAGVNTTRTVRSPSPAPEPMESTTNEKASGKAAKKSDKKPPLACLFCRGRKIACGPPVPGGDENTCNQCHRRSLKCEYPSESRRGLRRKRSVSSVGDDCKPKSVRSKR